MKKTLALLTALCLILTSCAAFGETDWEQWNLPEEYKAAYSDTIAFYYDALNDLSSGSLTEEEEEELRGSIYMMLDCGSFGYTLLDLDGNGIPELIFATKTEDEFFGKMVLEMYTIKNGELFQVFRSWERNRYYYAGENRFAHEGSSGADDSFESTEAYENGEMKDLDYITDREDFVQLDVDLITPRTEE